MSGDLPAGWSDVLLGDVAAFNPKHDSDIPRDMPVSFVPMQAVSDRTGKIEAPQERLLADVWRGYTHFANDDVIFAKITPCMENGKVAIAQNLQNGLACGSTEFFVIRPNNYLVAEYLWHFLRQKSFRSDAAQVMTGAVGQRRVPLSFLQAYRFPLPPLAEQRRIVARIEALFARTRRARTDLERVAPLASRYRQRAVDCAIADGLASGWPTATLGSIAIETRNGISAKPAPEPPGTPILRISAVRQGRVALDDRRYHFSNSPQGDSEFHLRDKDLLFVRFNGNPDLVAACGMVRGLSEPTVYPDKLIRVRLNEKQAAPQYVEMASGASAVREQLRAFIKTAAGQHGISGADLKAVLFPVPTIPVQSELAAEMSAKHRSAGIATHEAARALALLDHLEQSILARAFRGELVPQDPNDEPAALPAPMPAATPRRRRARA